jgi:two-component system chemotaxis response regulator CheB
MVEPAGNLVVVGASAGGVEALTALAADLPGDLDAAVAVVLHLPPGVESRIAHILERAGPLPAEQAEDGQPLERGRIYVARPGCHLLVRDGRCRVVRGPHENGLRPAIDPLFRSAAVAYGRRAVAVVLSGTRDDGVAGASAIGRVGGCVFVQDPDDALFPVLPAQTVTRDHPNRVLPLAELPAAVAAAVDALSREEPMGENDRDEMSVETDYAALEDGALERPSPPGESSVFSCPSCGGVLWELDESDDLLRFRCRVGHAFTANGVVEEQGERVEEALWTALRALQERGELSHRLAERMRRQGSEHSRRRFGALAEEAHAQAETIRRVLAEPGGNHA